MGKVKYGQQYYDYNKGLMTFIAPKQVQVLDVPHEDLLQQTSGTGLALLIHPDFLYKHPLATTIKNYGFFSYALSEALYLSDKEKEIVTGIFRTIAHELTQSIDYFSQDIMVSQIEQLLNYSNRFTTASLLPARSRTTTLWQKWKKD